MVTVDREKIIAAIQVDRLFKNFRIEMGPDDAIHFVEVAPLAGAPSTAEVSGLIESINKLIPLTDFGLGSPQTGKPRHSFHIGRESDRRVIELSIFKGFFPVDYDYWGLLKDVQFLCQKSGAVADIEPAPSTYSAIISWPRETEAQS